MKCTVCGWEFDEKAAEHACRGCPVARNCHLVRCPNCGLETPVEPKWAERLRSFLKRRKDDDAEQQS
jgi:hypothetical protein